MLSRPGLSIKLSGLHPRYERARRDQVLAELLPRLLTLARLARHYDIGLNIDAEESERLALSLDLLEALCRDPSLTGWNGVGFVVQAYGKRAYPLIGWLAELARATDRRLAVRLVKGAYWDSEIKRAQLDGAPDYPVFTRKSHTDLSYIACAQAMLSHPDAIYPQFATHNAQTLATIEALAGPHFQPGQYEFQCLHGMGEPLYEAVVGAPPGEARPCRIYAPVGTHGSLLAYLVRRLLENGANASFVSRIADPTVSIDDIVADPVARLRAATPSPGLPLPPDTLGTRRNSAGLDLADEPTLVALGRDLTSELTRRHDAGHPDRPALPIVNPANPADIVGLVHPASADDAHVAMAAAIAAQPGWQAIPALARATILRRAADLFEAARPALLALMTREAGKTLANGVGEVREAVDFLRYYADEAERITGVGSVPLGPVLCISPWNFPLSIFTGQVAAALAAGNTVLAKPAEESPLTAAHATRLLLEAGIPPDALHLLIGDGELGAALVADPRLAGVVFTGSEPVARAIRRSLAGRLGHDGDPIPLIAETGGVNALIVDSSALPEQVVVDAIASAFDSAGQRCSALRLLCVAAPLADRLLPLLRGAMATLRVGNPDRLGIDIGPVITATAADAIRAHVDHMATLGCLTHRTPMPPLGPNFVAPTLIELAGLDQLPGEVFGPVLHVLRYKPAELDALLAALRRTGFGLTFGLATRIESVVDHVLPLAPAGNCYVNRSIIGAVVGVQPFGGHGRSGTGPKAGGPLYLRRLLSRPANAAGPALPPGPAEAWPAAARRFCDWLDGRDDKATAETARALLAETPLGVTQLLPGPVGERNSYTVEPRGAVLCRAADPAALHTRIAAALATGNQVLLDPAAFAGLPRGIAEPDRGQADHVLFAGTPDELATLDRQLAARDGALAAVQTDLALHRLVLERSVSVNTAAAGGNAELIMQAEA